MQRLVTDEQIYNEVDQNQGNQSLLKSKFYPFFIGQNTSFLGKVFFQDMRHYCQQLITKITSKGISIQEDHLPNLSPDEDLSENYHQIQKEISTRPYIQWSHLAYYIIMGPLRSIVIICFFSYLLDQICKNSISLIISIIIQKVQDRNIKEAGLYILLSLFLYLLALIGIHHGFNKAMQFSSKSRMILVNLLYKKLSTLNAYTIKQVDESKILNMITGDISGLEFNLIMMFQSSVIPFALIYGSAIMWYRFNGPIGMLALLISLVTLPIQMFIQKRNENYLINGKVHQDERIKLTNQLIDNIRLIKMYCWQEAFISIILTTRQKEFRNVLKVQLFSMYERVISNSSQIWASIVFFCIIYFGGFKEDITTADMIGTLQLMATFKQGCIFMASYSVQAFIGIRLTFQRICSVLNIQNQEMNCLQENNALNQNNQEEANYLQLQNFSSYWSDKQANPTLYDINLNINKGEVWGIIGKVGSGKSTFLNSFLGEIPYYKGSIQINGKQITDQDLKFAYVEQEPFIFPDTIRNNILFGRQFNKKLYEKVLHSSCLQEDIDNLIDQDNAEIGEKGLNISGGQKARLSLARALYSRADIYLFDDPLSAVDSTVAQHIFNFAIKDFIKNQDNQPIVILVTHQVQYIRECDKVLVLDQGKVVAQGEYNSVKQSLKLFNSDLSEMIEKYDTTQQESKKTDQISFKRSKSTKPTIIKQDEVQQNQSISQTYLRYFKYWGYPQIILIIIINIIVEAIVQMFYFTVASYNSYSDKSQAYYLMLYLLAGLISFNCIKFTLSVFLIQFTSNKIHKQMITSLSKASINYFDSNPSGRILNRFSNDLLIADNQTSSTLIDIFEIFCSFSACIVTLCLFQPYFIFLAVTVYVLYGYLFTQFKTVINQMKQVELLAKSPMVIFFKKTLQGIIQIRIYQQQQWFRTQFLQITNQLQLSQLCYFYVVRCFGFHIDLIGFIIQVIGYYLFLELNNNNVIRYSQSILLLCSYNDFIQWGLRQLITFETDMNSYNRMFEIVDIKPEEKQQIQQIQGFPEDGSLEFKNVQCRYRETSELVLKGMNFTIKSGEKIGCVGRTGAGKSSIIQVIFRMCEIEQDEDSWIKISNVNTKNISLLQLRQSMSIIPQQPFLFSGSIKANLDPFNKCSEQQIWNALEQVNLRKSIEILNKSLDTDVNDFNTIFSVGQKQLICLARVILNKKKIIVLDEATANIDIKTDEFIQQIIKNNFKECTVITIAHRLNTIADYDKVMVIQDGTVAEFDSPFNLLAQSQESQTIDRDSQFSQLVQNTGKQNSQVIFEIAKNSRNFT